MTCARGHRPRQHGRAEPLRTAGPRSPFSRSQPTGWNAADLASKHPYYLFTLSRAGKTKIILGPVLAKVLPSNASMIVREVSDF
jgi:hypothetical protein